jgi:hypothetical protein
MKQAGMGASALLFAVSADDVAVDVEVMSVGENKQPDHYSDDDKENNGTLDRTSPSVGANDSVQIDERSTRGHVGVRA